MWTLLIITSTSSTSEENWKSGKIESEIHIWRIRLRLWVEIDVDFSVVIADRIWATFPSDEFRRVSQLCRILATRL